MIAKLMILMYFLRFLNSSQGFLDLDFFKYLTKVLVIFTPTLFSLRI